MPQLRHIIFTLIITKHFNFCCFRVLAYTTLDKLRAVFLYNITRLKLREVTYVRKSLSGRGILKVGHMSCIFL